MHSANNHFHIHSNLVFPTTVTLLALILLASAQAQVPQHISYQGSLWDGSGPAEGLVEMRFELFLSESGNEPVFDSGVINVEVQQGLFRVLLGPLDDSMLQEGSLWLQLTAGGTLLSPRQPLASSPFALRAGSVDDGVISSDKLATGAVVADRIADGAVTTAKLANNAVTGTKIAQAGAADGQVLKWSDGDSAWLPADDVDTQYLAGSGLTLSGQVFAFDSGFGDGRYARLGSPSPQTDNSSAPLLHLEKATGTTGNLITLRRAGSDRVTLSNSGQIWRFTNATAPVTISADNQMRIEADSHLRFMIDANNSQTNARLQLFKDGNYSSEIFGVSEAGDVTATRYFGDGSTLDNLPPAALFTGRVRDAGTPQSYGAVSGISVADPAIDEVQTILGRDCTATGLAVRLREAVTANIVAVSLDIDGLPSLLICTVALGNTGCTSNDEVDISAGDLLAISVVNGDGVDHQVMFGWECR